MRLIKVFILSHIYDLSFVEMELQNIGISIDLNFHLVCILLFYDPHKSKFLKIKAILSVPVYSIYARLTVVTSPFCDKMNETD